MKIENDRKILYVIDTLWLLRCCVTLSNGKFVLIKIIIIIYWAAWEQYYMTGTHTHSPTRMNKKPTNCK